MTLAMPPLVCHIITQHTHPACVPQRGRDGEGQLQPLKCQAEGGVEGEDGEVEDFTRDAAGGENRGGTVLGTVGMGDALSRWW